MKKGLKVLMTMGLMLAMTTPALAETKLNGYYRMTAVSQNIKSKAVDPATQSLIDQRMRMKLTYDLNDNVSVVYYGEVDTVWGEQSKGKVGGGGKLGTDGVNLETKNAYVTYKAPESALKVRLGLQGFDDLFQNIVISEDAAGALVSGELGPVNFDLIYSKFDEGERETWDDEDFYGLHLTHKVNEHLDIGAATYLADNNNADGSNSADSETFWYGLVGDYRFSQFGVKGFVVLQDGELKDQSGATNVNSSALAASIRGAMTIPKGDVGLRLTYFSDDDSAADNDAWNGSVGEFELPRENLMIFLPDRWINNTGTTRYAMADAATAGFGLYALTATANLKELPLDMYANFGAGAFWAAADQRNGSNAPHTSGTLVSSSDDTRAGEELGYELSAQIGKKFAKKFDLSLRGAYADFGDFYDDTVVDANGQVGKPDSVYKVAFMANVKF